MTQFLLVRHGTTGATEKTLSGWMNGVRLNDAGRAEVRALGERLADAGVSALYTSPLDRARETAALLGDRLGLDPVICHEAAEIRFGEWNGRDFSELNEDPGFRRWNAFRSGTRAPGGEMMLEVQARMMAGLERLRAAHPDATLLVVSHADVIKAALASVLGMSLDLHHRIEISPASISRVVLDEHAARVVNLNDSAHVQARSAARAPAGS